MVKMKWVRAVCIACWVLAISPSRGVAEHKTPRHRKLTEPIPVTVCELSKNAKLYDGRVVKVRGTFNGNMETTELIDSDCDKAILLRLPDDTEITPSPGFQLDRDKNFEEFWSRANETTYPGLIGECLNGECVQLKYRVSVVAIGRFDLAKKLSYGFGHLGSYRRRFVLKQVIDYCYREREVARH
jgi:hypothetical protein